MAQVFDNLVLMCTSLRFHKQISDLISCAGYRDFDIIALPGAYKAMLKDSFPDLEVVLVYADWDKSKQIP